MPINSNFRLVAKISAQLDHSKMHNWLCAKQLHLKYIPGAPVFRKCWNNTGCLKKNFLLSKMPWQILLLAVRNPYETLGNTSKTPSPSLTTSKCASTCDEFFPNCFVVFQARCCILLPKIVIPEQRCLQSPRLQFSQPRR